MKRFFLGVILGAAAAVIAHTSGATPEWALFIGCAVAVLVWVGRRLIEAIADAINDHL